MLLYSHNNEIPKPLPERIRMPDGRTRTDSSTFTEEELLEAGYVLAPSPTPPGPYEKLEWTGTEWVINEMDQEEREYITRTEWNNIREERNRQLASYDWMVIKAAELGESLPQDFLTYRQKLRDITLQADCFNITWPVYPTPGGNSDPNGTQPT